ncbi:hypothetical protein ACEZ3G_16190 [Maribacter algicola]|uniref:Uncharacterized protein n=1 Tax=Meishania litoralis TaxID=3434685 RepID=A0ACC7LSN9_9FLAO
MRIFVYLGLFLLITGCKKEIHKKDMDMLAGYWEIVQVTFPDGNKKTYNVNTNIDYFVLDGEAGFRKKVQPKLNGTFETSDDAEPFAIIETKNGLAIHYKNAMSEWIEEIVELNENSFSVQNEEGMRYQYRRFELINVKR